MNHLLTIGPICNILLFIEIFHSPPILAAFHSLFKMISHKPTVGNQLLAAILANDEHEFLGILDAHCHQILALHLDIETEITKVTSQIRDNETVLCLQHHAATLKMVAAQMADRLMPKPSQLLAA